MNQWRKHRCLYAALFLFGAMFAGNMSAKAAETSGNNAWIIGTCKGENLKYYHTFRFERVEGNKIFGSHVSTNKRNNWVANGTLMGTIDGDYIEFVSKRPESTRTYKLYRVRDGEKGLRLSSKSGRFKVSCVKDD